MRSDRTTAVGPPEPDAPEGSGTDHSLLYGLLAFQVNFIDQEAFIDVIRTWVADRSRPIREVLKGRAGLTETRLALLDGFLREYLAEHGDDPREGLSSLGATASMKPWLEEIGDVELREALGRAESTHSATSATDGESTRSFAGGDPRRGTSRYRVVGDHKSGGLGAIYLARDEELNRLVALKEIKPPYSDQPEYRARFLREAEITGRLQHPGVIPVYGLGQYDDGRPYYAMRFIPRGDLKQAIAKYHGGSRAPATEPGDRALAFRELLGQFRQACQAMAYAHSRGVIHRDLKPANILLGDFGETFVVDWGLAKPVDRSDEVGGSTEETLRPSGGSDSPPSLDGQAIGTIEYMSPEQATGHPDVHTHLSDIHGLGATLYCILTGQAPFSGVDKFERARRGEFPRPTRVRPGVPPALEAICLKAMAARPVDRYPNALAIAEDVDRWLADEPVSVYRDPPPKRLARWVRRHRTLVAASAALVMAGVIGLIADDIRVGREQARTERALAESRRHFDAARESAYELFTMVARDLPRSPGSEPARLAHAEVVAGNYRKFLLSSPEDEALRSEAAQVEREAGNIGRFTGQSEPPLAHYRRALELLDGLIAGSPAPVVYRIRKADTLIDLAEQLRLLGRYPEAGEQFRAALDLARSLRANPPKGVDPRRLEAYAWMNLAGYQSEVGDLADARRSSGEALELLRSLAGGKSVADDVSIKLIISTLLIHGAAIRDDGGPRDAEPVLGQAIRLAREKGDVVDQDFRFLLAIALDEQAQCFEGDARRRAESLRLYNESLRLLAALRRASPAVPAYRRQMVAGCNGRAGAALLGGDLDLAAKDSDVALAFIDRQIESRGVPVDHALKGRTLANLARLRLARGDWAGADELLGRAIAECEIVVKALPHRRLDEAAIQALGEERAGLGP